VRRLDRALEAEGDDVNRYKAAKQADTLMLCYLLTPAELLAILHRLGYPADTALIRRTIDYYLQRTSHGSTLSALVHAWVLAGTDRATSWDLLTEALKSDIEDVQGGTTQEGIHLGAMAGTLDLLQRCYLGLEIRRDGLRLDPLLPDRLGTLSLPIRERGARFEIEARDGTVRVNGETIPRGSSRTFAFHQGGTIMTGTGDLGRRIAHHRDRLGLTREQGAERSGVTPGYIEYLEESPGHPTAETISRLADALEATRPRPSTTSSTRARSSSAAAAAARWTATCAPAWTAWRSWSASRSTGSTRYAAPAGASSSRAPSTTSRKRSSNRSSARRSPRGPAATAPCTSASSPTASPAAGSWACERPRSAAPLPARRPPGAGVETRRPHRVRRAQAAHAHRDQPAGPGRTRRRHRTALLRPRLRRRHDDRHDGSRSRDASGERARASPRGPSCRAPCARSCGPSSGPRLRRTIATGQWARCSTPSLTEPG